MDTIKIDIKNDATIRRLHGKWLELDWDEDEDLGPTWKVEE